MKFVRFSELKDWGVPWSRVHVDRLERAGKFPRRVHLGENTVAWAEGDINAWLAARQAASAPPPEAA